MPAFLASLVFARCLGGWGAGAADLDRWTDLEDPSAVSALRHRTLSDHRTYM